LGATSSTVDGSPAEKKEGRENIKRTSWRSVLLINS
jgi:hypothetical protein